MKRHLRSIVIVNNRVFQDELKYNGEVVLKYRIDYPQFISVHYQKSLDIINKFYLKKALNLKRYYIKELCKLAVEDYKYSKQNNLPIKIYEGVARYKITYNMDCIISLFYDEYVYSGGAHGNTQRTSDTWNLRQNRRVKLNEFFQCDLNPKEYILNIVKEGILKEPIIYFDDYEKLIDENFNPQSFYCTQKGLVIYYQQYDIAPYSSGIRKFLIPYNDCVINPYKMCRNVR